MLPTCSPLASTSPTDSQRATVERQLDVAGLEAIADVQVAFLELEASSPEYLAVVQALVEGGEVITQAAVAKMAGADFYFRRRHRSPGCRQPGRRRWWNPRMAPCRATVPAPSPRAMALRLPPLVVAGRQIDGRAARLANVAVVAAQQQVAAPAVLVDHR
ncbi:hypothetical protein L1887_46958 [Cichorium endivia]|nr:hypothetical protein L1887_46958 [Cichorium endivia]